MKELREAFTMIELIFVIVIIGILAAVALPKLMGTRDDALHAKLISNTKVCIDDLISGYKGQGDTVTISSIRSCKEAIAQGASINYTSSAVKILNVDPKIDGEYIFKGRRISI